MSGPLRVSVNELNYYVHFPWREGAALCLLIAFLESLHKSKRLFSALRIQIRPTRGVPSDLWAKISLCSIQVPRLV